MANPSDIANYHRLEAEVNGQVVTHTGYRSNPRTGERRVPYKESWVRGKFLGHGACGAVLLEENVADKSKVRAVKILSKSRGAHDKIDPFDEAEVMSLLSHPRNADFFINFFGWYETHDTVCLVMEYVQYGDLDNYLYKHGPLEESSASTIVKQLLEGLEVLHQINLIHRDLKPSNILIQHTSPWWVKIGDFGISRRLRDRSAITYTGGGTNGFKAPEIVFGERTRHTTAADMWSLGCVAYNILTNSLPFQDGRDVARFRKDSSLFYQDLETMSNFSPQVKTFIKALIVLEPRRRTTATNALTLAWIADPSVLVQPFTTVDASRSHEEMTEVPVSREKTVQAASSSSSSSLPSSAETETSSVPSHQTVHLQPTHAAEGSLHTPSSISLSSTQTAEQIPSAYLSARRQREEINENYMRELAKFNDARAVSSAYNQDTDLEAKDSIGMPPLMAAAYKGDEKGVEFLLSRGANVDAADKHEWTALIWAVDAGHEKVVELLLNKGADIEAKTTEDYTPLTRAVLRGYERMIELVLSKGANIEGRSYRGMTPLMIAAYEGNERVVELLLGEGADTEAGDDNSWTALMHAAWGKQEGVVKSLLSKDVDIETKAYGGKTALMLAQDQGYEKIAQLLHDKSIEKGMSNKKRF